MKIIDLTDYRPKDRPALLGAWREQGLCGMDRHLPWLIYLWMPQSVRTPPPPYKPLVFIGSNGAVYHPSATLDLHVKRSDKAKVHTLLLTIGYEIYERDRRYTLKMNATYWGNLKEVPDEFPDIFPDRGESVYNELLYAYSKFWQSFVRPFVGVRHEELHTDNSDAELSFSS